MKSRVTSKLGRLLLISTLAASGGCSAATPGDDGQLGHGDASPDVGESTDVGVNGDAPAVPSPQGSLSLHVQEYDGTLDPTHAMDRCPPGRHWVNIPYQREREPSTQSQQTSDSVPGTKAVDGQDGNSVACSVKANGNAFAVSVDANGYAATPEVVRKPSIVHIRIPSIAPSSTAAAGTLTMQDDASLVTYTSSKCTFSTQGGSLGIDAGRIWASVQCEDLIDPATPGAACQLSSGFFLFENCAK